MTHNDPRQWPDWNTEKIDVNPRNWGRVNDNGDEVDYPQEPDEETEIPEDGFYEGEGI